MYYRVRKSDVFTPNIETRLIEESWLRLRNLRRQSVWSVCVVANMKKGDDYEWETC